MFKVKTGVLVALFTVALSTSAFAAPFTGGFSKSGNFRPVNGATGATATLLTATGIDFLPLVGGVGTPGVAGQFLVNSADGDFAVLLGLIGSIKDFSFAGAGSVAFPGTPIAMLELVGGVTFDLLTVGLDFQNAGSIVLSGTGLFKGLGFDDTAGTFTFAGTSSGRGTFSFSASQAAAVPEPASALLLGLSLLGGAHAMRRRKSVN